MTRKTLIAEIKKALELINETVDFDEYSTNQLKDWYDDLFPNAPINPES